MQEIATKGVCTPQAAEPCQGVQAEVNEPISSQSQTQIESDAVRDFFAKRKELYLKKIQSMRESMTDLKKQYRAENYILSKQFASVGMSPKTDLLSDCHRLKRYLDRVLKNFYPTFLDTSYEAYHCHFEMQDGQVLFTITVPYANQNLLTVNEEA